MLQALSPRQRSWAGMAWLIAFACGLLVAVVNIYAGVALVALFTLVLAAFVLLSGRAAPPMPVTPRRAPARLAWAPVPQRSISTADGAVRPALVIPLDQADGFQMVLTGDGYALVDDAGQVVYTLRS